LDFEIDVPQLFQLVSKICKEKEYNELQTALCNSYNELMKVEVEARMKKASSLIRGIQAIDRELKLLNFEYDRVKRAFNIDGIPYFDQLISEINKKRKELVLLKNSLK